jgi:excisionase family DNA binding protein
MSIPSDDTRYLSPSEAAARLMVSPVTLRHWALAGKLAFVTTPGGHRRYAKEELEAFADRYHKTVAVPNTPTNPGLDADVHKILIVGDEPQFTELLVALLQGLPEIVQVEVANDGFEAGQKMLSFRPRTILLDLTMPGFNAIEVCRKIKNDPATQDNRVVAITGCNTSAHVRQAMEAGAAVCLAKPVDKAQLLKAIVLNGAGAMTAQT